METKKSIFSTAGEQVKTLIGWVVLLWAVEITDWLLFRNQLPQFFGIQPRAMRGLFGILSAPFLHGDFAHLFANTLPLLTLGWLVMLRGWGEWVSVTVITALCSGLGTWLFGASNSTHIGASGIIFGYFGFLLLRGYFERSITAIAFSILVTLLYGGIIFGILPTDQAISWEGHLFGFLGGVLSARILAKPKREYKDNYDL